MRTLWKGRSFHDCRSAVLLGAPSFPIVQQVHYQQRPWLGYGFSGRQEGACSQQQLQDLLLQQLCWSGQVAILRQVHGARIVALSDGDTAEAAEADGWQLDRGGVLALIRVADCIPAVLYHAASGQALLLHAGRSGVASGILHRAVELLLRGGAPASQLQLVLGPGIGGCCYQVPHQLAAEFTMQSGCVDCCTRHDSSHSWLDLKWTLRCQALQLGLDAARIHSQTPCTLCQQQLFYSHRGGDTQLRQYAFAWIYG